MTHTPGPWHVFASGSARQRGRGEINDARGLTVAEGVNFVADCAELSDANARLIAAAPELLDAAIRLLATFDELKATTQAERIITGQSMTDLRRRSEQAIADLRAAAAKAQGET